jgi:hypothetical protein
LATRPDDLTFAAIVTAAPTASVAGRSAETALCRFEPGVIIGGRYRLIAMLGRGGMGEVYRADDLTLDQPVALKFLPAAVGADDGSLARFHNELRVARQVSHKNVCRLYDIGEADGHRFLTMEYIDGEDLASLLRRIGRLPQDKAVQIARQLCAGVAAAHERGVLHRDLKPANVMIDGEGNARITDFGIATAAADVAAEAAAEAAGTPQYMAPELFAGRPASPRSDIYALGLTLYELFTGKRAVDGRTLGDLRQLHESGAVTPPTALVRDLDPTIERAILRCTDRDPDRRPPSALAVAAMLPGADALADALAAGETPSPELLAAAGETDALGLYRAVAALAAGLAGVLLVAWVSGDTSIVRRTPLDKPPAVLTDRAQEIVRTLGHEDAGWDTASGFYLANDYLDWIRLNNRTPTRWDAVAAGTPSAVRFWYRSAPIDIRPLDARTVTMTDPPFDRADMRLVVVDADGRLQQYRWVPPQRDEETRALAEAPWPALFTAAGLDIGSFRRVDPAWAPADYADSRMAWEGKLPGRDDVTLRVEAASHRGGPVAFDVIGPWTRPGRTVPGERSLLDKAFNVSAIVIIVLLLVSSAVLARRHLATGRADRRGARRLALALVIPLAAAWLVRTDHTWVIDPEIEAIVDGVSGIGLVVVLLWATYLAVEPYVRRFWPHVLLGWSRLLAGHVRDPRVGADALAGVLFGVLLTAIDLARATVLPAFGWAAPFPVYGRSLDVMIGGGELFARWVDWGRVGIQGALLCVLLIVMLRVIVRLNWLALIVATLVISQTAGTAYTNGSGPWIHGFVLLSAVLTVFVAVRFGLLALVVSRIVWNLLYGVPLTLDYAHWSATASNWTLALVVALLAFGFYASRAGQPLFGKVLKD